MVTFGRAALTSDFSERIVWYCAGLESILLRGLDQIIHNLSERLAVFSYDTVGERLAAVEDVKPGFPFCLLQMAPLYTRETPSARNSIRRTIVQFQRPSPQPTLTWNRPEPLLSRHFSDTAPHLCPFFASLSLHSAARQPAGTGSVQILRSISPKSRRFR